MTRKSSFSLARGLLLGLACFAPALSAGTIQYQVAVDTSGFAPGTAGFIDFQFNQANSAGSLSALASIDSFTSAGYTFDDTLNVFSTPGVSGSLSSLPLTIQNDQNGANFFAQGVSAFGGNFNFLVTLSGAAIGGVATDPSAFVVILEDTSGAPLFPLLGSAGEVASITVNADGSTTGIGSRFAGGSAAVTAPVPEPSTLLTGLAGLLLMACGWRR